MSHVTGQEGLVAVADAHVVACGITGEAHVVVAIACWKRIGIRVNSIGFTLKIELNKPSIR